MTVMLHIFMGVTLVLFAAVSVYRIRVARQLERRADEVCGTVRSGVGTASAAESLYRSAVWRRTMTVLGRLGFNTGSYWGQVCIAVTPLVVALAALAGGWQTAVLFTVIAIISNTFVIRWLETRRARRFTRSLPAFLERVRRFVLIGNTFQQAFIQAAGEGDALLKFYIDPVVRRVRHGASIADSMDLLARQIGTSELYMLASYVRTNAKFGGRVAENLGNLIAQMDARERLEREVSMLTAETRASAVILIGLTVALITFVGLANPTYVDFFLRDDVGKILLAVIIGWPLLGLFVMKRVLDLDL